jgi:hypothetical protein
LAAEWGLASLLGGGFLFLGAPIILVFDFHFYQAGRDYLDTHDMREAFAAGILAVLLLWAGCIVSILFGAKGLLAASAHRQPAALPLAGVLFSAGALVAWLIVGFCTLGPLFAFVR